MVKEIGIIAVAKNDSSVSFYKIEREVKFLKRLNMLDPIIAMDYCKIENKGYFFIMMDLNYSFYLISTQNFDIIKRKEI